MLSQTELLIAILTELERQHPGIELAEDEINILTRMADRIVMMLSDELSSDSIKEKAA